MILYNSQQVTEVTFVDFELEMERRNEQWIDIVLTPVVAQHTPLPEALDDFTILVVCFASDGSIMQMIPQNEGCDCEFQFTTLEKAQIRQFIERPALQQTLLRLPFEM